MNLKEFIKFEPNKPLYAVLGNPVEHSISPMLHSFIYKEEVIDAQYIALHIENNELAEFMKIAKNKLCGFNVTIPYKSDIIPFLDEIDKSAKSIGSVNTVKVKNGKLKGYNTDLLGITATFEKNKVLLKDKNVLVLGNGGVSKAIVYALSDSGAHITIAARTKKEFIMDIPIKYADFTDDFSDIQVVINGTPLGMQGYEGLCPIKSLPKQCEFVFDVVYTPLSTPLISMAYNKRIAYENGLYMLLIQGVMADQIWFDKTISQNTISKAYKLMQANVFKNRLQSVYNKKVILLSGFMGSGKTTLGKKLAQILGFDFYDTDEIIEKQQDDTIKNIFVDKGEAYFRQLEKECLTKLNKLENAVISAGGGAMVNPQNYKLCKNMLVIYLDASVETLYRRLIKDTKRPLLQTGNPKATIKELLEKRRPFYEQNCDIKIDSNVNKNRIINQILSI